MIRFLSMLKIFSTKISAFYKPLISFRDKPANRDLDSSDTPPNKDSEVEENMICVKYLFIVYCTCKVCFICTDVNRGVKRREYSS